MIRSFRLQAEVIITILSALRGQSMNIGRVIVAAAFMAFTGVVTHLAAQGTPPPPPAATPQQPAPPAGRGGQGRGGEPPVFPAQQRPPGDPVLIERGKALFTVNCVACHGSDLRGGVTGGPNLLRSQVVLADEHGEQIIPIVHGARAERGMPALPLPDDDVIAIAEYIHSVLATAQHQGAPPPSAAPIPNAIVGDAAAGQVYFNAKCSSCHSPAGDLQGVGSRVPEGKALQNLWISGGTSGGGGRRGRGAGSMEGKVPAATATLPGGERLAGPIVRMDNFLLTVRQADGTLRTIRRDDARIRIEIKDPLDAHRQLLGIVTDKDMHDVTAYLATLK
jgi:cytochrome c oxidase cbb3-type subunit III